MTAARARSPRASGDDRGRDRDALAAALGRLHGELHTIYKPDDNAPEVRRLYRDRHPAANAAAEAIVIFTRRPGAPGFDR